VRAGLVPAHPKNAGSLRPPLQEIMLYKNHARIPRAAHCPYCRVFGKVWVQFFSPAHISGGKAAKRQRSKTMFLNLNLVFWSLTRKIGLNAFYYSYEGSYSNSRHCFKTHAPHLPKYIETHMLIKE